MVCPKCNKELMNINGRNICVECGTEVSDNELNQQNLTLPNADVLQEVPMTDESAVLANESEMPASVEPTIQPIEAPISEESTVQVQPDLAQADTLSPINNESIVATEAPELTESAPQTDSLVNIPIEINTNPVEPSPQAEIGTTEVEEPEMAVLEDIPVTPELPTETNIEVTTSPTEPVVSEMAPAAPIEIPVEKVAETVANIPNPTDAPAEAAMEVAPEPLPQTEATMPAENSSAEVADFSNDKPIDPFEVAESTPVAPTNPDQNIYQNPMFDQVNESTTPQNQPEQVQPMPSTIPTSNKKLLLMLAGGAIIFMTLLVGGVYAYKAVTKPAVIEESQIDENNITEEVEIDDEVIDESQE